jgi:hypothetical protein
MSDEPVNVWAGVQKAWKNIRGILFVGLIVLVTVLLIQDRKEPTSEITQGAIDSTIGQPYKLPEGAMLINPAFCYGNYLAVINIDSSRYLLIKIGNSIALTKK